MTLANKRPAKHSVITVVAILIVFALCAKVWSNERHQVPLHKCLDDANKYVSRGQLDKAIDQYSQAIELGGDKAIYCYERGACEQLTGQLFLAEGDYRKATELNPKNVKALVNLAEIQFRFDDFAGAFKSSEQALACDPKNVSALTIREMCHTQRHEYQFAVNDTTTALSNLTAETESSRQGILVRRAAAYRYLGKTKEAQQDIESARKIFLSGIKRKSAAVFAEGFANKFVRPRFTLYANGGSRAFDAYMDFVERFLNYLNANVSPIKTDSTFQIFLFDDANSYGRKLIANGEYPRQTGFYSPTYNALFTYQQLDNGTTARELVRKSMAEMPFTDPWAREGIPNLFARTYGYVDGDSYKMYVGVQKPWLSEVMRKRLMRIDLVETLAQQYSGPTDSEGRVAAVFLYRHGKLLPYLQLCRNGQVDEHVTLFETVFGKSAIQLEPEWMKYLQEFDRQNVALEHLPTTTFFSSKQLYDIFMHVMPKGLLPPDPPDKMNGNK